MWRTANDLLSVANCIISYIYIDIREDDGKLYAIAKVKCSNGQEQTLRTELNCP